MKTIILISCASRKADRISKARDLYSSALFRLNLAYAEQLRPDAIYILSAKHGLLALDDKITPYNETLNDMSTAQIRVWADRVHRQLQAVTNVAADRFIFLAGVNYREYLAPRLPHHEVPLRGLPIGKQVQRLKKLTS